MRVGLARKRVSLRGTSGRGFIPRFSRGEWLALSATLILALVLRGSRLDEAPAGFLTWNEGFYIDLATRMVQQPLFSWFVHPLDTNNPPLFSVVVSWLYRLGTPQVAGARIVSVLAGSWTVFVTSLLGTRLYSSRVGLLAAALVATMPGVVLVDHNIQVDALFTALMITSVYAYVLAAGNRSVGYGVSAGVLMALAFLTKQAASVAVISILGWEVWRSGGKARWLRHNYVLPAAGAFLLVAAPWYLVQLVGGGGEAVVAIGGKAAALSATEAGGLSLAFWTDVLVKEVAFLIFPATALLAVAGLVRQVLRRSSADKLVLSMVAGYFCWYLIFHIHSYYLLPLAPFLAVSTSVLLSEMPSLLRGRGPMVIQVMLVTSMVLATVLMMAGHKWGRWSPMGMEAPPGSTVLYMGPGVERFMGPASYTLDAGFDVRRPDMTADSTKQINLALQSGEPFLMVDLAIGTSSPDATVTPVRPLEDTWYRPVLLGYALSQDPQGLTATQRFAHSAWSAERVGPLWYFGVDITKRPSSFYLYDQDSFRVRTEDS